MAKRRWDDRWQRYAESVPIPARDGLATSKQRGAMAASWWSRRFVDVLRVVRPRRSHATRPQYTLVPDRCCPLTLQAGMLVAQVQGSRSTPYVVTVAAESADGRAVGECRRRAWRTSRVCGASPRR